MKGSEAVLRKFTSNGKPCVIKDRIPKKYRIEKLDISLRKKRTRSEGKLLQKINGANIASPKIYSTGEFSITMEFLDGKRAEENEKNIMEAGILLAKIHSQDVIHGDYTFANLMDLDGKLYVFDFGLGYFSNKIEHKAVDVFTMLLSLHDKKGKGIFLESYLANSKDKEKVRHRLETISKRIRYS